MAKTKIAAFFLLFCVLFILFSWFLRTEVDGNTSVIYYEDPNTIDVLFVGSSQAYMDINPNVLWRDQGIASFNYAGGNQAIWSSYFYIQEALKYQKPLVVFLDVWAVSTKFENDFTDQPVQIAYSTFRPSLNKLGIINSGVPPKDRMLWHADIMFFHTRWKNITSNSPFTTRENYQAHSPFKYKGFVGVPNVTSHGPELNAVVYPSTDEFAEIPEKNKLYLMKIIELSKNQGFQLVLIKSPTAVFSFEKASNSIAKIARDHNIPFIDFHYNSHRDAMGLDYQTDFLDGGHLNMTGAEKLSKYIAEYLNTEYDIPDRRGDERYISWDESADGYFRFEAMQRAEL
ncbi:MAG: hypothetical protein LBR74_00050 [Eubacterium sp.]|jgi:hypothetical protein|nr:hypothetical protein [Eubacterium sp.]